MNTKILSVMTVYQVNPELMNKYFKDFDEWNVDGEKKYWLYSIPFENKIPNIENFLKELARKGSFEVKVETDKFYDTYHYTYNDKYIIKKHIPDEKWEEQDKLNLLKELFRDIYSQKEKIYAR